MGVSGYQPNRPETTRSRAHVAAPLRRTTTGENTPAREQAPLGASARPAPGPGRSARVTTRPARNSPPEPGVVACADPINEVHGSEPVLLVDVAARDTGCGRARRSQPSRHGPEPDACDVSGPWPPYDPRAGTCPSLRRRRSLVSATIRWTGTATAEHPAGQSVRHAQHIGPTASPRLDPDRFPVPDTGPRAEAKEAGPLRRVSPSSRATRAAGRSRQPLTASRVRPPEPVAVHGPGPRPGTAVPDQITPLRSGTRRAGRRRRARLAARAVGGSQHRGPRGGRPAGGGRRARRRRRPRGASRRPRPASRR